MTGLPGTQEIHHAQDRQHRAHIEHGSHTLGHESTEEAAERADAGDLAKAPLCRARVESLGGHQPEPRAEHRPEAGDVEVYEAGSERGARGDEEPLDHQHQRADEEEGGDEHRGWDAPEHFRAQHDEGNREEGGGDDHGGEGRHVEIGQVEGVAGGLARYKLGGDHGRAEHGGQDVGARAGGEGSHRLGFAQ